MMYPIEPLPKPRMTRADKWKQRACVMRYRAFKDECRAHGVEIYPAMDVVFRIPMPDSWSAKKRSTMAGQPHQQKPDIDNLAKALLDAVCDDDSHVWHVNAKKIWAEIGAIEIEERYA